MRLLNHFHPSNNVLIHSQGLKKHSMCITFNTCMTDTYRHIHPCRYLRVFKACEWIRQEVGGNRLWKRVDILAHHFHSPTYRCLRIIIISIINPLTARVVGALQMILQPVFSIFPCSPLPSVTCRTSGLSIP